MLKCFHSAKPTTKIVEIVIRRKSPEYAVNNFVNDKIITTVSGTFPPLPRAPLLYGSVFRELRASEFGVHTSARSRSLPISV